MAKDALLDVEESIKYNNGKSKKDGYLITKRGILLLIIIVILLVITVGLIARFSTTASSSAKVEGGDKTTQPTTKTLTTKLISTKLVTSPGRVTTGKEPYLYYRLSKNLVPEHYDVLLKADLYKKTVSGTTTIKFNVTKPTSYVYLHAYDYKNIEGFLRDSKGKDLEIRRKYLYNQNQYYVIETKSDIDVGEYILYFEFDYTLKKNLKGFYESTYKTSDGKIRPVAATQFQAVSARTAFPCFDEPAMKATFTITLAHQKEFIAISNMDIKTNETKDGMIYDTFEKTPIMPTYLVAFVVCDFAHRSIISNTRDSTSMTYYAPKHQISQLNYSMEVGSKILGYFEQYFHLQYPLKKADMIAIPDFAAGAMENWGLVTYRSSALLYDKDQSAVSNKLSVNAIVSHELAHQWFGNIVTMRWWSDLWLNEGFASYVEYLGMNASEPTWNVLDFIVIADMASGLNLDALMTSHPIFVEVKHPSEIDEIFDSISYSKGSSVLRMLDNFVGTEAFKKGLINYLEKYKFSNADTNDLFKMLTDASAEVGDNINVTEIMNTWVLQMGFPVINVTKESGGTFSLKQQRFLRDPNPDTSKEKYKSKYGYKWHVPFNYEVYDISNTSNVKVLQTNRTWLHMDDASISGLQDSDDIIIKGNTGQYGFFRVNYEVPLWKKLQQVLKNNHEVFDVKDRVGLISDAFAMANSDRLDFGEAMNVVDYIHLDKDYLPWKAASSAISSIPSRLPKSSKARKTFKKYMLSKVNSLFAHYELKPQTEHLDRYLQILISSLACGNGHTKCLSLASGMFKQWMSDPVNNKVPGDLRSLVYYYGVNNGGQEEWDFVFKQYLNNKIASEKSKLLYALAATKEDWLIDRYLNYALNESIIKSQDVSAVFSYVANSNPNGRYKAWNFMKASWKIIEERFVESFFTMRRIFQGVTGGFNTEYELHQMKRFVETEIKNQGSASRIIKQSEESIKTNIEWIKRNEKPITVWLEEAVKSLL